MLGAFVPLAAGAAVIPPLSKITSTSYVSSVCHVVESRLTDPRELRQVIERGEIKSVLEALSEKPMANAMLAEIEGKPLSSVDAQAASELSIIKGAVSTMGDGTSRASIEILETLVDAMNVSEALHSLRTGDEPSFVPFGLFEEDWVRDKASRSEKMLKMALKDLLRTDLSEAIVEDEVETKRNIMELSAARMLGAARTRRLKEAIATVIDFWNLHLSLGGKGKLLRGGKVPIDRLSVLTEIGEIEDLYTSFGYTVLEDLSDMRGRCPSLLQLYLDFALARRMKEIIGGEPIMSELPLRTGILVLVERSFYRHLYLALGPYKRPKMIRDFLEAMLS